MSRSLTVLAKTISDHPHTAGFEFNTGTKTWTLSGPGADMMKTRKGTYKYIGAGQDQLCLLLKEDGSTRVGDMRGGFIAETVPEGSTGTGNADETGSAFTWTADKSVDI